MRYSPTMAAFWLVLTLGMGDGYGQVVGGLAAGGNVSGGNLSTKGSGGAVEISLWTRDPSSKDTAEVSSWVSMEIWMHNQGNQTVKYRESGIYDGGFPIFEVGSNGEATLINGYKSDFDTQTKSVEPNQSTVSVTQASLGCFPALNESVFVRMYFTRPDGSAFAVESKPVQVGDLMTKAQKESILHPKPMVVPVENAGNVGITLATGNFSDRGDWPKDGSLVPINVTVKNNGNQTVSFGTSGADAGGMPIYKIMSDGQAQHFSGKGDPFSFIFFHLKPNEQYTWHTAWPVSMLPAKDTDVFVMLRIRSADGMVFQAASKPQPVGELMPKKEGSGVGDGGKAS